MSRARTSSFNKRTAKKLTAPSTLTAREREIWETIVAGQSAAWSISGCEIVLENHVRTGAYLENLYAKRAALLADSDNGIADLADVDAAIEKAARLVLSTSRALRLVQVARVRENLVKDRPRMPWEPDPDDTY